MFRYKQAKHKSNAIHINITAGADYLPMEQEAGGSLCLRQGECKLSFQLLPGDHTAYARYEAGTMGGHKLVGETAVCYKYERGMINVCAYDYVNEGYYEKQHSDTPPVFRLYQENENKEADAVRQPLLEVSSAQKGSYFCSEHALWMENAAERIREQLRTIYMQIIDSLREAGIYLCVHLGDEIYRDENGRIVGGTIVKAIPAYQNYFYNIEGSSGDKYPRRQGYTSWLDCYDKYIRTKLKNNLSHDVQGHLYCASADINIFCGTARYLGGHVFCPDMQWAEKTVTNSSGVTYTATKKSRDEHMVKSPNEVYHMLPICYTHNNTNYYNVVMYTGHIEDVMVLTNFKS